MEDEEESDEALNREDREFTMSPDAINAAMAEQADILGEEQEEAVVNPDPELEKPKDEAATLIEALEKHNAANAAISAYDAFIASKPLTNPKRRALLEALTPGGKVKDKSKMTKKEQYADALLQLCELTRSATLQAWMACARKLPS